MTSLQRVTEVDLKWATVEGEHFAANEDRYTKMLQGMGERVIAAAEIEPDSDVLDVGCGYGALTLMAADAAADGEVTGLDISDALLSRAHERAAERGAENVTLQHGDAVTYDLPSASFDRAVSRLGVMFFEDPHAAFANICSAVRPGGRLAFACWKDVSENEHMMVPLRVALEHIPTPAMGDADALSPFSLADPDGVRNLLEGAGWRDVDLQPYEEGMWWGPDAADVVQFIAGAGRTKVVLANVDEAIALRAAEALQDALQAHKTPEGVFLGGAYWIVTARRP
jgi:SAM-dependent methyltransferase